jgi:hypothetical protein
MGLSYDRLQNEYVHFCCHDIGNNGVDKSGLNVSDNLCVSTVISKTVKRKNSVEDCVNQTFLRGIKISGCRREKKMNG